MSSDNTQLTDASDYDIKRITFSKPETGTIPGGNLTFKRIRIGTRNEDGTQGDLILPTTEVFSFGVQENKDLTTGQTNGYIIPLCLWNKNGASKEEQEWTDTFDNIVEHTKEYILNHKDDIDKYDLEKSDLKKLNPLYWKRERGKIVEGRGPTLYAKLITSKKLSRVTSVFYNGDTDEEFDPMLASQKYCYVKAAIKIESIFIGNKVSLQIKLYEASVRFLDSGPKRLLRPKGDSELLVNTKPEVKHEDSDSHSSAGSLSDHSDDEDRPKTPPAAPKKVVRRKVVRK